MRWDPLHETNSGVIDTTEEATAEDDAEVIAQAEEVIAEEVAEEIVEEAVAEEIVEEIAEEIVASTVDLTQLKALQGRTISHEAMETTLIPGPLLAHRPQC